MIIEISETKQKSGIFQKSTEWTAVFIKSSVFAHSFYRKMMSELSHSDTLLYYLNGQCNIEKSIVEIYQSLTND